MSLFISYRGTDQYGACELQAYCARNSVPSSTVFVDDPALGASTAPTSNRGWHLPATAGDEWRNSESLTGGLDWIQELSNALARCDAVVVLLSCNSAISGRTLHATQQPASQYLAPQFLLTPTAELLSFPDAHTRPFRQRPAFSAPRITGATRLFPWSALNPNSHPLQFALNLPPAYQSRSDTFRSPALPAIKTQTSWTLALYFLIIRKATINTHSDCNGLYQIFRAPKMSFNPCRFFQSLTLLAPRRLHGMLDYSFFTAPLKQLTRLGNILSLRESTTRILSSTTNTLAAPLEQGEIPVPHRRKQRRVNSVAALQHAGSPELQPGANIAAKSIDRGAADVKLVESEKVSILQFKAESSAPQCGPHAEPAYCNGDGSGAGSNGAAKVVDDNTDKTLLDLFNGPRPPVTSLVWDLATNIDHVMRERSKTLSNRMLVDCRLEGSVFDLYRGSSTAIH